MQERTCSKCDVSKPETEEFFRKRGTKDRGGLRPDCRDCTKARDRAYYEANRERYKAYQAANAERIRAYMLEYKRAYYRTETGKAAIQRANRRWNQSPEGKARLTLLQQRRRARVAGLESAFATEDWTLCLEWFGQRCAYCGGSAETLHQEHVIPVESGGPYVPWNIVPACGSCNSSKTTKPLDEWFPGQPFYAEERMAMIADYFALVSP
ncbi:HNH endonuclease [Micromonospora sp. ATA32]|nr:HNH endonuclease [Micromonospora sp. ATA32]